MLSTGFLQQICFKIPSSIRQNLCNIQPILKGLKRFLKPFGRPKLSDITLKYLKYLSPTGLSCLLLFSYFESQRWRLVFDLLRSPWRAVAMRRWAPSVVNSSVSSVLLAALDGHSLATGIIFLGLLENLLIFLFLLFLLILLILLLFLLFLVPFSFFPLRTAGTGAARGGIGQTGEGENHPLRYVAAPPRLRLLGRRGGSALFTFHGMMAIPNLTTAGPNGGT